MRTKGWEGAVGWRVRQEERTSEKDLAMAPGSRWMEA
jgi:hypothetical protein